MADAKRKPATDPIVLSLERTRTSSFAFVERRSQNAYDFHVHVRHQLLYATAGTAHLEVAEARYLLPPQRIAFIPAGLPHATAVGTAEIVSLYLHPRLVPGAPAEVCVTEVTPLLREMVIHAKRWPRTRRASDRTANAFFRCLGLLLPGWLAHRPAYRLPRGRSELVTRAIDALLAHPGDVDAGAIARRLGTSPRTLRRRFQEELGQSLRELATQARVLEAMERLLEPGATIASAGYAVGFRSLSSFTRSFGEHVGMTPSAFRAEALGETRERSLGADLPPARARRISR